MIDLRFYDVEHVGFIKLMKHDTGATTFTGNVIARELSGGGTNTQIDFCILNPNTADHFERAINAFNEAWNGVELTDAENAAMTEYLSDDTSKDA